MQTLAILLSILKYLVSGGAGVAASWLFDWLRARYAARKGTGGLLDRMLFSPRYVRLTVLFLSALIALPAAALAALIEGRDALQAVDALAAPFLAFAVSQFMHARTLPVATDTMVVRIPDAVTLTENVEVGT